MIALYDIQRFIIQTLQDDDEFNAFAKDLLGKDISYFIDANVYMEQEKLPSLVAFGINKESIGKEETYIVQYILSVIQENDTYIEVDGIKEYPTKKILEKITDKSLELIKKTLRELGINGICGYTISNENIHLSDIGEASDIQGIVSLQILKKHTI